MLKQKKCSQICSLLLAACLTFSLLLPMAPMNTQAAERDGDKALVSDSVELKIDSDEAVPMDLYVGALYEFMGQIGKINDCRSYGYGLFSGE